MLQEKVNSLPFVPVVKEEIQKALTARASREEMNEDQLNSLLSHLRGSLQVFRRDEDGSFSTRFVKDGAVMMNGDKPVTVKEWIDDYVVEPDGTQRETIREDNLGRRTVDRVGMNEQDFQDIAAGKKSVVRQPSTIPSNAIPASDISKSRCNIEDIASGKVNIDMSR